MEQNLQGVADARVLPWNGEPALSGPRFPLTGSFNVGLGQLGYYGWFSKLGVLSKRLRASVRGFGG